MIYEPSTLEVLEYKIFGNTLLIPYYRSFVRSLALNGSENVLEYGSGPGFISKLIVKLLNDGQLTCYDISGIWLTLAQRRLRNYSNAVFNLNNLSKLEQNSFDKIVIHYAFHDVPTSERKSQIEKLYNLLKINGEIIIREPIAFNHGIPPEEIKTIMQITGLKEQRTSFSKALLMGEMFSGTFKKQRTMRNTSV